MRPSEELGTYNDVCHDKTVSWVICLQNCGGSTGLAGPDSGIF